MSTYLHESRDEAEERFRILAAMLEKARRVTVACEDDDCSCCELLRSPVGLPASIARRDYHEPREDLERGSELICERMMDAVSDASATSCPGGEFLRSVVVAAEKKLGERDGR